MPFERAIIKQIRPNVHLIDDAGESTCYLITGSEKALLVDTANGYEDLNEIVRSLTNLPVIVVNTHGHGDHIYGNVYFEEAWLHPADFALYDQFFGYAKDIMEQNIIIHDLDWDWIAGWVNLQTIYSLQTCGEKVQRSLASAMEHFGIEQTRGMAEDVHKQKMRMVGIKKLKPMKNMMFKSGVR